MSDWIPIEEVELEIGGSYWVITETGIDSWGVWECAVVYHGEYFGVECDISLEEVSHVIKITKPEA